MAEAAPASLVIVVPFVAWGAMVERCTAACVAQPGGDFLVCLVASDAASVPARWARHPCVEVIDSAGDGISHKRNLAIAAHPQAEFFACIDSDAWPMAGWLDAARRVFADDPGIWLVGGPNLSPPALSPDRTAVADALLSVLVSGPKNYTKRLACSRDAVDLPACNLFIRRQAIAAIGGFDETVEVGEDSVLCQAVVARGKRVRFSREVRVFHEPRRFGVPFLRQRIVSGYGIPPLLRRCHRSMGLAAIIAELLPAMTLLFFVFGWIAALVEPALGGLWLAVLAVYLLLIVIETLRLTRSPRRWPLTAAALLAGNLAPGIGTLYRCLGVRLPLASYYRNDA